MTDPSAVFLEVFSALPRQGPGRRDQTARALEAVRALLPASPRVLDVGCGTGAQTLDLAELLPEAAITAVDVHAPFLDRLAARARTAGVDDRVTVLEGDMRALALEGPFDLVWCEGAAYIIGFAEALAAFARVGPAAIALTEPVWTTADPPASARAVFDAEYPAMGTVEARLADVAAAGLEVRDHFPLPDEAWWDDFYGPMRSRVKALRSAFGEDAVARRVLDDCEAEIEMFVRDRGAYGYAFFALEVPRNRTGPAA